MSMSDRVNLNLNRFVQPVSSSKEQTPLLPERDKQETARDECENGDQDAESSDPPPRLKLVVSNPSPEKVGNTGAFLSLITVILEKKDAFARWLGTLTYRTNSVKQRKFGKLKKGTMYDHLAQ